MSAENEPQNEYTATVYDPQENNSPDHPGGTTNRVMWNEKYLLDEFVWTKAKPGPAESLKPNNDPYKVGIYARNHQMPDYD